jgi:hypothetical protein
LIRNPLEHGSGGAMPVERLAPSPLGNVLLGEANGLEESSAAPAFTGESKEPCDKSCCFDWV